MAQISLHNIKHSYMANPQSPEDYALQQIDLDFQDGGAYALLGPSGCGKTTLLNLISGLHSPSHGNIYFDEREVTKLSPEMRNIAQVFQFPVIYDTMSVYDNLAFPLKNRQVPEATIAKRVGEIAEMLEITPMLKRKAAGLSPDNKQKLSMGRGLVRDDVNVVMFDEPLTVIDPHLKWKLRSKLKELHQRVEHTMIYVTHDQTEALTFADKVVVMNLGEVVQIGTPVELFERPGHAFVGHFIGSPGMNLLDCEVADGSMSLEGHKLFSEELIDETKLQKAGKTQLGIRPEFISLAENGIPARVSKVSNLGRHAVLEAKLGNQSINLIHQGELPNPGDSVFLEFAPKHTRLYADGWLAMK